MNNFLEQVDNFFGFFVEYIGKVLFFDISFNYFGTPLPLIVIVLLFGAIYFTFYFKFIMHLFN